MTKVNSLVVHQWLALVDVLSRLGAPAQEFPSVFLFINSALENIKNNLGSDKARPCSKIGLANFEISDLAEKQECNQMHHQIH